MDDRVIVGYDTSTESAAAVRWAATEAARRGWGLEVVHVWGFAGQEHGGAGDSWLGRQVLAQVQEVADEGAALARETAPDVEAAGVVLHGSPAATLVARAADARLVVLGRHGAGRISGALVGSVASGVLHHASGPVVVVPDESHAGGSGDPVVVGFDGSPGGFGALEAACDQAEVHGTEVVALTAWTPTAEVSSLSYWTLAYPRQSPGEVALDDAERVLERARSWSASRHDVTVTCDLAEGRAADVLVRRSRHASLVVVGTRGRGGFASLVLGSTSRAVVQRAHCPVLVTRGARAHDADAAGPAGREREATR
ncbi:universal stress protein [Cellulomonas hominis]|uniref:universal stress protein n=1 Tax=Cellulomonas hominis TaxID=156981 RepID=UPI001443A024|nr:universal stress protein [Cellulomonas hominis]NKY09380.1 universal stress protein [Cellulomonas hominis]